MIKTCINPKNYSLTLNKHYTIISDDGDYYSLVNDNNKCLNYSKQLFESVDSLENVAEIQDIPTIPTIERTEQDCIDSIVVYNENITFNDINDNNISFSNPLNLNGSSISCGVFQLHNINSLITNIKQYVDTSEYDMIALTKQLFVRALLYKISEEVYEECCRFAMLSTNYIDENEDFYTWLDELSSTKTEWLVNPNSENEIKVWVITNDEV